MTKATRNYEERALRHLISFARTTAGDLKVRRRAREAEGYEHLADTLSFILRSATSGGLGVQDVLFELRDPDRPSWSLPRG